MRRIFAAFRRRNTHRGGVVLSLAAFLFPGTGFGSDWAAYRGPTRNGVSTERIQKAWPPTGPRLVWKVPLIGGFSTFSIAGGRAFTMVRRTVSGVDSEVCLALDAATGAELWSVALEPADYDDGGNTGAAGNTGGDGPRSTPVVDGNHVFTLSSHLKLACFEAATGRKVWSHDLPAEYGASVISWQNAASPVVEGNVVILNANVSGQRLMAFQKATGILAWKGLDERLTQSTPVVADILGVRQVVFATQSGLLSIRPDTGAQLWRSSLSFSVATGISPVVVEDTVYLSAAYNVGAMAVKVAKSGSTFSAARLWRKSGSLQNHWSTPVHHGGHLYGLYGYAEYGTAPLKCVELSTGTELWSVEGFGQGGLLLVDGVLLVLSDAGDLVMVQPDPSAYRELRRFRAVAGKCWNAPALSNGKLYVRSTREGACYDVSMPPLRWKSVQSAASGGLKIEVGNEDGSAMDAVRAARLQLRTSTHLAAPLAEWGPAAATTVWTNGLLRFLVPVEPGTPSRMFIAVDPP
jgi:outer membrane protein assembly factor BamB